MLCVCVCVLCLFVFFLMIRRPPRSTLDRSSAASDVYKRQVLDRNLEELSIAPRGRKELVLLGFMGP